MKKSTVALDGDFDGEHYAPAIKVIPGELLSVEEITQVIINSRGSDIECLDLEGKSNAAKFMVIATAKSYRHVHKIVREILDEHKRRGVPVARPIEVSVSSIMCCWYPIIDGKTLKRCCSKGRARRRAMIGYVLISDTFLSTFLLQKRERT